MGRHRSTFLVFFVMLTAALFTACSDGMTGPELEAPASVRSNVGSSIGDATTQSTCSADPTEGCYIIGTCNEADAFQSCHEQGGGSYGGGTGGSGGSGGSGGGGTGGGSTGGDSGTSTSTASDEVYDCHTGQVGTCDLAPATAEHIQQYNQAVERIRTDEAVCSQLRNIATEAAPRLQVWTNKIEVYQDGRLKPLLGDAKYNSANQPEIHLWSQSIDAATVAHEAAHFMSVNGIVWHHGTVYEGRTFHGWAEHCTRA
ncbi:MAG TPA: hypothetical protein VHG28_04510 [Longimicrobiaceae bacterium]|nr:hypothetical protein [Longimicrobiaceae bacterium]